MANVDYKIDIDMAKALRKGYFDWLEIHTNDEAEEIMANPSGRRHRRTKISDGPDSLVALVDQIFKSPFDEVISVIEALDEEGIEGLRRFVIMDGDQFYGTAWTWYLERRFHVDSDPPECGDEESMKVKYQL